LLVRAYKPKIWYNYNLSGGVQMTDKNVPLILITNDDGIDSPGLVGAVRAVHDLGEVLVVAPKEQQTGAGRSLPSTNDGVIIEEALRLNGSRLAAYSVRGSPAQAVQYGVLEVASRRPALVVAGINYGENVGSGVTISGTVGAALEAAAIGVPALAVSVETGKEYHYNPSADIDLRATIHFTRLFARLLLTTPLPPDVHVLKIEVPCDATEETPWRWTRVSRQRYYYPTSSGRTYLAEKRPVGYEVRIDPETLEPDSDVAALARQRVVSVSPLSLDLTSRVDFNHLDQVFRAIEDE
jgi:5'-nucleotidase